MVSVIYLEEIMTTAEVLEKLRDYKIQNEDKYGIMSLGIFGSYSRGMATSNSDIDIVIETKEPDIYMLVHIKDDLEKIFNKSIDIVRNRKNLNRYLNKRINRDALYV